MASPVSIPEFFAGQSVLITGATGFIGKVLVEKLLRSCRDINKLYLLIRPKRGQDINERVKTITGIPLFDRLREEYPDAFSKLQAISGDVTQMGLGLSAEDRQLLQDKVSVIFHMAATVRFDSPLTNAVLMNVRGTREVVQLAEGMKHLKILVHTSTTYCNTENETIEERLYEAPMDWRTAITAAETLDPFLIRAFTNKILGYRPNTYTFTKALAEHIINDHREQLPVVIVRPSIVISSVSEPVPGWIDNYNGPMGLVAGGGKGLLHAFYWDDDVILDIIPVDTASKGLIIASWHEALNRTTSLPIYNNAFPRLKDFSMRMVTKNSYNMPKDIPFNDTLYHPCGITTNNALFFFILFISFNLLPAMLIDAGLRLAGRTPRLMKLQRSIFTASMKLFYFSSTSWTIKNSNFIALESTLLPEDRSAFGYHFSPTYDMIEYYRIIAFGVRRFLFNEDDSSLPKAHRHFHRMKLLHNVLKVAVYVWLLWISVAYSLPQKLFSASVVIARTALIL